MAYRPSLRGIGAWAVIALAVLAPTALFAWVGGVFSPERLTPARFADRFEANGGLHPGFRRNHAKGVCLVGSFRSSGAASAYSMATVFRPEVEAPVVARLAVPGQNPHASDAGGPVRSLAVEFRLPDGGIWRMALNNSPVFGVSTPREFYAQLIALQPDPATGRPDKERVADFFASHPDTRPFMDWAKATPPSRSWATQSYNSLNAFYFVDREGRRHAVRWSMESVLPPEMPHGDGMAVGPDDLAADLEARLARGPAIWKLAVTLAESGDPTGDATIAWPEDRRKIEAGTLTLVESRPQTDGLCRDINYDPTVLPPGIEISDDPLLAARAAVYARSHERRTAEEARLPGFARPETGEAQ